MTGLAHGLVARSGLAGLICNHETESNNLNLDAYSEIRQHSKIHMTYKQEIANLKQIVLNQKQICDLELILNGALSPLVGYMTESEYESVLATSRLSDGSL